MRSTPIARARPYSKERTCRGVSASERDGSARPNQTCAQRPEGVARAVDKATRAPIAPRVVQPGIQPSSCVNWTLPGQAWVGHGRDRQSLQAHSPLYDSCRKALCTLRQPKSAPSERSRMRRIAFVRFVLGMSLLQCCGPRASACHRQKGHVEHVGQGGHGGKEALPTHYG